MKIYNKILTIIVTVCLLLISTISDAKVKSVTSRRDFEQSVARESMVVALFYNDQSKDLMRMYEDVSKDQTYDDADVIFLKVNAARKDLIDLATLYGVTIMPAFVLFHKGKRLTDNNGNVIIVTGFVSRDQLESMIDTYYGIEIDQYIAKKEARKQDRIVEENERWKPYFYPRDMFVPGYDPSERDME